MNTVKEYREKVGITQNELAIKVDRSVKTIQAIEQGIRRPGQDLTIKIFKTLKIPISKIENFLAEYHTNCSLK